MTSKDAMSCIVAGTSCLLSRVSRMRLVEVTSRLRSYLYKEFFQKDTPPPISGLSTGNSLGMEAASPNNITPARDSQSGGEPPAASYNTAQSAAPTQLSKVIIFFSMEDAPSASRFFFTFICATFGVYSSSVFSVI